MKTRPTLSLSIPLVFLAPFFFPGCSSISHTLIAPEVESPLIASEKAVDFVIRTTPGREVTLFNDASNRPPIYSTNFMAGQSSGGALLGGVAYSLKGVSFSGGLLGANSLIEGIWAGGKLQLLGRHALFSDSPLYLTGWGRIGGQHATKDGNDKGAFGPAGFPWAVDRTGSFLNIGLSIGYEVAPWLVPFIGYGKGSASGKATLEQKLSVDGSSPAASYSNSFDASIATWGGGVQIVGENARFTVSMQNSRTEVGGNSVIGRTVGLAFEFKVYGPSASASEESR